MKNLLIIFRSQIMIAILTSLVTIFAFSKNSQFLSARKGQITKSFDTGQLLLSEQGLVEFENQEKLKLMRGTMWVNARSEIVVDTLFAQIHIPEGQVWFIIESDRIKIKSISSFIKIKTKSGQQLEINRGFETWIGLINTNGHNEVGVPSAINFNHYLQFWAKYYRGSKKKFISEANQLREELNLATTEGAEIFQEAVNRQIASVEAQKSLNAQMEIERRNNAKKKKAEILKKTFSR